MLRHIDDKFKELKDNFLNVIVSKQDELLSSISILNNKYELLSEDLKNEKEENMKMRNKMGYIEKELKNFDDKLLIVRDLEKSCNENADLIDSLKTLQHELTKKDEKIGQLEERLCHQEQYSRKNMFEIRELEYREGECISEIILKLAQKMTITLEAEDIQAAHRLKSNPGRTPGIIVSLRDKQKRDAFVNSKVKLLNADIYGGRCKNSSQKLYIGASLSPYYRNLLLEAKRVAKSKNYKHCWWGGVVKVRKDDQRDSPVIIINKQSDLSIL